MHKARLLQFLVLITCMFLVVISSACGEATGVCTGYNSDTMTTYCKDGWTKAECDDWNDQQINGVDWYWHEDQTCAERGTPATP